MRALAFRPAADSTSGSSPTARSTSGRSGARGRPVAWQSPTGFRSPALHDAEGDGGARLQPQLLGLPRHLRARSHPPAGNGRPLHGRSVHARAADRLWRGLGRDEPILFCEGEVVQARYGGEILRLRRRISAPVGGRTLTIQDIVTNDGAQPTSHALLYHINLGYPAVSDGTEVHLGERRVMGPLALPDFGPQPEAKSIPVALGETASCQLTTPAPEGSAFRLDLSFSARTLPYLQLWRDLRPHAGVVALEPCTSAREAGGASGPSPQLERGEARRYRVDLTFDGTAPNLPSFTGPTSLG